MLLARHAGFRASQIHNDVRPFHALHGAVHQFAHALVVFRVNGVALSLPHLLKDHLLGSLRGDASQHVGGLGNLHLALDGRLGVIFLRILQADLVVGVLNLLHDLLDGVDFHQAGVLIEMRLEVFGSLVILPRRHQDGIFHRRDNDLRVNALLTA